MEDRSKPIKFDKEDFFRGLSEVSPGHLGADGKLDLANVPAHLNNKLLQIGLYREMGRLEDSDVQKGFSTLLSSYPDQYSHMERVIGESLPDLLNIFKTIEKGK